MKDNKSQYAKYDTAELLDTDNRISEYLKLKLAEGDPVYINDALITIARAKQMTDIADKMGIAREDLFEMLLSGEHIDIKTINKFLQALNLDTVALPKRHTESPIHSIEQPSTLKTVFG